MDEALSLLRESSGSLDLNLQNFDLVELLTDLVDTVNYEIPEGMPLIEFTAGSALLIDADRELLWRVFENLLRNALIHGGSEHAIQVEVKQLPGDQLQVCVQDAGPGIAEEHISRVFDPFYRVDESRNRGASSQSGNASGGHGLGLAIAASAVRRHGGWIEVSNAAQGGLRVSVILPQQQTPSGA